MKRTLLVSLFLCLCVGLGADIHAQEAPPVDQLMQDGSQAYQHGDFEQAVERWTQAAAAYERSAARAEQIDALIRLSEAYQSLGRYRTAAIRLDQAKALAAGTDDSLLSIRILWRTGNLYQAAGQHAEAEQSLQEALQRAKALPQASLTAAILNDLGNLAASQGKFADALASYIESFHTAQAVPVKLLAATSQVNAARVSLPLKQYRESKTRLDQAADILRGLEPSHEQISAFITVGLTYAKLRTFLVELNKDLTLAAFQALHDAARVADQLGDRRASSFAWGYLGKLYEDERRYAEALDVTQHAILMGQQAAAPEALYRWHWQAGRLLERRSDGLRRRSTRIGRRSLRFSLSVRKSPPLSPKTSRTPRFVRRSEPCILSSPIFCFGVPNEMSTHSIARPYYAKPATRLNCSKWRSCKTTFRMIAYKPRAPTPRVWSWFQRPRP